MVIVVAAMPRRVAPKGEFVARVGLRSFVAGVVAVVLACTVGGAPAFADEPTDPGGDRSWVVSLLTTGTPSVRRAAEAALLGSEADLEAFVDSGFDDALDADYRASAQVLASTDGPTLTAAALAALEGSDEDAAAVRRRRLHDRVDRRRASAGGAGSGERRTGDARRARRRRWRVTRRRGRSSCPRGLPAARFADERLMAATMLAGALNNSGPLLDAAAQAALAGYCRRSCTSSSPTASSWRGHGIRRWPRSAG